MIEAVRIYDHYRFRTKQEDKKKSAASAPPKVIELRLPPRKPADKPFWRKFYDDPILSQDRLLFS
jgi:hypothetical protein